MRQPFMAWGGADSGYGSLYRGTTISSFHQIINKLFAALIKEVVGGAYTAYSKKEAEWDSFLGVVRVTGRLEKVLMFVSGFCVQICMDLVFAEAYLYIQEG